MRREQNPIPDTEHEPPGNIILLSRQASQARRRRGESGGGWAQENGEEDMVWLLSTAGAGEEAESGPECRKRTAPKGSFRHARGRGGQQTSFEGL